MENQRLSDSGLELGIPIDKMKFAEKKPPREFVAGEVMQVVIKDCGAMNLDSDEQITFKTEDGGEYDVVRKNWGFYATPSMNGRLQTFGFKSALVKNSQGKIYIMLVEDSKIDEFLHYIERDKQKVVEWLDERKMDPEPHL